jgi:hypothetical protein
VAFLPTWAVLLPGSSGAGTPCLKAIAGLLGERRSRNGQYRAAGVGQAVPANTAAPQPPQRALAPGANDQPIAWLAAHQGQCLARLAAQHHGLGTDTGVQAAKGGIEGVPQPLLGLVFP